MSNSYHHLYTPCQWSW